VCGGICRAVRTGCPHCHELFSVTAVKRHSDKCERLQAEAAAKKKKAGKKAKKKAKKK
jgi:hypothetical protein